MRLAFMGTPEFAVPVLHALVRAGHLLRHVYTQPPRAAGRGQGMRASSVHLAAEALGLPVSTPERFRGPDILAEFADLALDAAVVVAYGQILPQAALDAPRFGCLNLHASLLPRWRGAAPIQRAVMAGDAVSGVCVMQMAAGLDTGPVRAQAALTLAADETGGSLHDRLAALGAPLMVGALAALASGTLPSTPQDEALATYAAKITKAEARLDWRGDAVVIERQIRGLNPAPGAWTQLGAERVKILRAVAEPGPPPADPGTVLDDQLRIACGTGVLAPRILQRAGRGAMELAEFLRGYPVPAGTRLG